MTPVSSFTGLAELHDVSSLQATGSPSASSLAVPASPPPPEFAASGPQAAVAPLESRRNFHAGRMLFPQETTSPVRLAVYDVSKTHGVWFINKLCAHPTSGCKFGGLFHVGLQVYEREITYGHDPSGSGVSLKPIGPQSQRELGQYNYRETLELGTTTKSRAEVAAVIDSLKSKGYVGASYNLLTRNCCHFADELSQALCGEPIPAYLHRFASIGQGAESTILCIAQATGMAQFSSAVYRASLQMRPPTPSLTQGPRRPEPGQPKPEPGQDTAAGRPYL
jgi:hypothetical protein